MKNVVISGSGLSGIMAAKMLLEIKDIKSRIIIVEREANIGGQFGSYDYGDFGLFDHGMHIFYETCINDVDKLFTSILPLEDWNVLEGNLKDIAGIFVNSRLQLDTPYVDLRSLPEERKWRYIGSLLTQLEKRPCVPNGAAEPNAYAELANRFGRPITDEVFVPILEKLYKLHPKDLDVLATKLTTIDRVALFDKELMLDLMQSSNLGSKICYPDQLTLPACRLTNQRGFYPRVFGMSRIFDRFKSSLEQKGVEFLTDSFISDVELVGNKIENVKISRKDEIIDIGNTETLFWTSGLPTLSKVLGIKSSNLPFDRKRTSPYYVYFLFDSNLDMGPLYYFYCFQKGFRTFRVTNYFNYCPNAALLRGFPICVEMWLDEGDSTFEIDIVARTLSELREFGILTYQKEVFSRVEKVQGGGFPLPSLNNVTAINSTRDAIQARELRNLVPLGVYSSPNVFFIKDVLIDAYKKVVV
jgi:protoporphyrinogen oxidase